MDAPYPLPLILAPLLPMPLPLFQKKKVRVSGRVTIAVVEFATIAYLRRAGDGVWFRCILLAAANAHTTVASVFATFAIGSDVQRLHNAQFVCVWNECKAAAPRWLPRVLLPNSYERLPSTVD